MPIPKSASTSRRMSDVSRPSELEQARRSNNHKALDATWNKNKNPFLKNQQDSFSRIILSSSSSSSSSKEETTTDESLLLPSSSSIIIPVLSASLLLASNTIGASCLALPQVAQSTGLGPACGLFLAAYCVNLLSGLAIAKVAIDAQQDIILQQQEADNDQTNNHQQQVSSFHDLVTYTLGPRAGPCVSVLSLLVNTCALVFDASRMGPIAQMATATMIVSSDATASDAAATIMSSSSSVYMLLWMAGLATLVATQSNQRLSFLASANVAVLMLSFGSVLVPALQNVNDDSWSDLLLAPGIADNSMSTAAPVILMAMVYQNIVPSIVKLLKYNWQHTVTAMTIGSAIPLCLYMAWCLACLAQPDGVLLTDTGNVGVVLTVFSVVTVMGSSMGSIMSLSEEIQTFTSTAANKPTGGDAQPPLLSNDRYPLSSVLLALGIPVAVNLVLGEGADLTPALALAGSVGSPLLYGAIPAMMLYTQQQRTTQTLPDFFWGQIDNNDTETSSDNGNLQQRFYGALPLLGLVSLALVGHELVHSTSHVVA